MALKLGTPDEPFGAAKKLLAAALDRVNDSAGVEVGVPTVVVNRGDKLPAEKDVTVPPPPDGHVWKLGVVVAKLAAPDIKHWPLADGVIQAPVEVDDP